MHKRDLMLSLLNPAQTPPYAPAAFFMHFGATYRDGPAAVARHLDYFRATGMDFVKIQYEHAFPSLPAISRPQDWRNMPCYGLDFYEAPLEVVKGLVKAARSEALVLLTLYSPFMCAGHTTSDALISAHLREDPEAVKLGLERITESLLGFVNACIAAGVDGFYASTQGVEAHRFADPGIFAHYIKPFDLVLMERIAEACPFNILHICDYCGPYDDLTPFLDYPGHVVNCSLNVGKARLTPQDIATLFGRPVMGGMDRHGIIAHGTPVQIEHEVNNVMNTAPPRFILGADCTLPGDTDWSHIRHAIDTAHAWQRSDA